MTSPTCLSTLVKELEGMEEELVCRVIPGERLVVLQQVSKTMRAAMERVRPPVIMKVKQGQRIKYVQKGMLAMMKCCRITVIDLSQAKIGDHGAGWLANVIGQCPSLAHLDLCSNGIGAEGAGRLAAVLGQCPSLAHLNLGSNAIGAEGAERLDAVAGQCPSLEIEMYD